jgi:hypothetical protein
MDRRLVPLLLLIGLLADPVSGQTPNPAVPAPANPGSVSTNTPSSSSTNAPSAAGGAIDAESRELKPHDVLRYRIEQDPVTGAEALRVEITDSGEAHFNVSRGHSTYVTVKAAGRKLIDIRRDLKAKLDAEYYKDVSIKLDLEGVTAAGVGGNPATALAAVAKVQVYGEMRGIIPLPENQRTMLSDVILSMAGNDFANLKKIKVRRVNAAGQPETHIVNIDKVLKDNDRSADFELKDGDRVEVPRKVILGL